VPAAGPEAAVGADAVAAVLRRIGWGETSGAALWVDSDGSWGSGPARGSWAKERAEFVGAGARAAHRRELLALLRARAGDLAVELAAAGELVALAGRRAEEVRSERAGYPAQLERELGSAHSSASSAERELERADRKAVESRSGWERAAAEAAQIA
jgi:hypothetical protein